MVAVELRNEYIVRNFLINECRITEFFTGYIVNFVKHVRSRYDASRRKVVSSPCLESSILKVVADRPESSTRAVAHHLRVLVAALWDKKLAFRTRERRKFWVFTDGPQRREKRTSSEAMLQLNSALEKESVPLKEDQTDL
ncbi:hypothetical protein TNCV_3519211 [Trichonephila clavipes]|uniref:Uncharacterized protein n=1 Tax=Trichonephila clavipes TaxID=2585209 RepID=A0A8X6SSQ7_TRICX|nr:hypothetical protein TNCV_3519211 [Trichonephila clavipes]